MIPSSRGSRYTVSGRGGDGGREQSPTSSTTERTPIRVLIVAVVAAALFAGLFAGGVVAEETDSSAESNLTVTADLAEPYVGEEVAFETIESDDVEHYVWSFGDGTTLNATEQTVEHTYDAAGDYTVELTAVGEDGETDTATTTVTVEETLEAAVDIEQSTPEQGAPVTILASASTGEIAEYRWNVSGRQVTTLRPSLQHTFARDGNQTVELTVTSEDGDTDTAVQTVAVERAGLEASLNASETDLIVGQPVQFLSDDSTGPIEERHWDVDGDGNATVRNASAWWTTHRYAESGNYTATITVVGANGENDTATANVSVAAENDSAVLDADVVANDTSPAVGETVSFDATGTVGDVSSYWWHADGDWHDGPSTNTYTFVEAGQYNVTLVAVGEDATDEAHVEIEVQPDVELNASVEAAPGTVDEGETVTFDANGTTGAVAEYRWAFGDGANATTDAPNVTHSYESAGEYDVELTVVGEDGETDSATTTVSVASQGVVAALSVSPSTAVASEPVTFDASNSTGPIETYTFDRGDGSTFEEDPPYDSVTLDYRYPGNYTVELTVVGEDGTTDTATANLTVEPTDLLAAFEVTDTELLVDQPVAFKARESIGTIETYHWDLGDGTTADERGSWKQHSYEAAGNYSVELTVEDDEGETDTVTRNVSVSTQNESANLEANVEVDDSEPAVDDTVTFDASGTQGDVERYWWFFDDPRTSQTSGATIDHSYSESGTYDVRLVAVGDDAVDRASVTVEVGEDDSGDDGSHFVPISSPDPDPGPSERATFEIADVEAPASVAPGAEIDVPVDVENVGDDDGTAAVTAELEGGSEATVDRALDADASGQVTLTLTAPEEAGDHELAVTTADDERTLSLTVEDDSTDDADEEQSDGADGDTGDDDGDDDGDDGTPGFGLGAAIVALSVGLLVRRRSGA